MPFHSQSFTFSSFLVEQLCSRISLISLMLLFSRRVQSESSVTPMDHSSPGCSVHGISQARILEWGAISSSTGNESPPNPGIEHLSPASPALAVECFTIETPGKPQVLLFWYLNGQIAASLGEYNLRVWPRYSGSPKEEQWTLPQGCWRFQTTIMIWSLIHRWIIHPFTCISWIVYIRITHCLQILFVWPVVVIAW